MADGFGNTFIEITDDDGIATRLEHLDTFELEDSLYFVLLPADMAEDDPDYGMVILRVEQDKNGDEILCDIESDEELNRIYEYYMNNVIWEDNE